MLDWANKVVLGKVIGISCLISGKNFFDFFFQFSIMDRLNIIP